MEKVYGFASLCGLGASGGYFWKNNSFKDFSYIHLAIITAALSLAMVIPRATFSDMKRPLNYRAPIRPGKCSNLISRYSIFSIAYASI
jgi:hypothetical protein